MKLDDIYSPVKNELDLVEAKLSDISRNNVSVLSKILEYALLNGGKRIRPALALLCGKFNKYHTDTLIPLATAVEILHIGTLVHDDIIDNSDLRHNKPPVFKKFGHNSALLLGDYLFATAGTLTALTENLRVVKKFSETLMIISGGELRQTDVKFDLGNARELYYKWIRAKTASLFVLAAEAGSVLSECAESEISALKEYALNFGLAFQLVDDILDFSGDQVTVGKPVGSDLTEGAITLPSIIYAEKRPDDDIIYRIIIGREKQLVSEAVEKIRSSGVVDECRQIAASYCRKACDSLEQLPDCESRRSLQELSNFIASRNK